MESKNESLYCKVCEAETKEIFKTKVLDKYTVSYFRCPACGFMSTESPFWLDEAYKSAINSLDVGLVNRNIQLSIDTAQVIANSFNEDGVFLDYAGGYGLFARLMRDKGYNFYTHDRYCENIFAGTFDLSELPANTKFELLTTFEVFEHLQNPTQELKEMFKFSDSILFSTVLIPDKPITKPEDWWYFIPETGQHISFFSIQSLQEIAKRNNCYLYTDNLSLHLFSKVKFTHNPFVSQSKNSFIANVLLKLSNYFSTGNVKTERKSLIESDFELAQKKLRTKQP